MEMNGSKPTMNFVVVYITLDPKSDISESQRVINATQSFNCQKKCQIQTKLQKKILQHKKKQ